MYNLCVGGAVTDYIDTLFLYFLIDGILKTYVGI